MSKIDHSQVQSLAEKLKNQTTTTANEATLNVSLAQDAYVSSLPEGVTAEILAKIDEHNAVFFPAATKAFGEVAIAEMQKNKALTTAVASIELHGKNHFDLHMDREKSFRNPQSADTPIVKHGYIQASVTSREASTKIGSMKSVCDELAEQAMKAFMG